MSDDPGSTADVPGPAGAPGPLTDLFDRAEAAPAESAERFELLDELRASRELATVAGVDALRAARLLAVSGDANDLPSVANLAGRAHQAGVDGAGPIHAEAVDKIALFQGRPQPYGTVMVEHQGDIVQPPVDPRTPDEERRALGLPSLADMQQRMADTSRRLATERARTPGWLPPGQRFCRVWTNPSASELRARMAAEGATAWADGDVLTFVAESDVPVAVTPVFTLPSWPVGRNFQVLQVRVERLEEAVITYTFTPLAGAGSVMDLRRGSHDGRFRGSASPDELLSNDPLVGSTFEHAIESEAFGEPRTVTVYRPPGHARGEAQGGAGGAPIPVVYATDGNMFAPYARRLDAAIEGGWCPPITVVAAHAAPANQVQGNIRALEYLQGFDDERFAAHQRFFTVELPAWAETELGVPSDPAMRGVFGCSDGGGHALTTGRLNPAAYGHVFAYSTGMPPDAASLSGTAGSGGWSADTHPMVHLCAGTLESGFHQATEAWAGYLHLQGARYHFTERVSGHDLIQWCEEFPRAVARAWG